jgi:pimeloyl-ACP methyl ester carboxylesterase
MRLRDLPPVYARLAGFLAGSLIQRSERCLPEPLRDAASAAVSPLQGAIEHLPSSVQRGWELAMDREGRREPPVLLVPGFLGPSPLLIPLMIFLRLHGRRADLLHNFPAFDGVIKLSERLAVAVERIRAQTGAAKVDIVCHSMGGLAARYYLRHFEGHMYVRRLVTIATPHQGTKWARWPLNQSLRDMMPGNPLLAEMEEDMDFEGVKCLNIRAAWDQIVWPHELSVWGPHATDHELPFSEHWAIQLDPRTLALVLTLLEAPDAEVREVNIAGLEGGELV